MYTAGFWIQFDTESRWQFSSITTTHEYVRLCVDLPTIEIVLIANTKRDTIVSEARCIMFTCGECVLAKSRYTCTHSSREEPAGANQCT